MKAFVSKTKVSPHGGIVPILYKIRQLGIPRLIRQNLGVRKKQSKYGYEDIIISWVLTAICGGTRLDHITKIKRKLNIIPKLKIPSHDTLGRVMKKLSANIMSSTAKRKDGTGKSTTTFYDNNIKMNRMLIKATKRAGALIEGRKYTLDIDATFIPTECRGALRRSVDDGGLWYTRIGFNPMICLIGHIPVFISMRNGSAGARFQLPETLKMALDLLEESKIKVGRVISDAAGYSKEAFKLMEDRGIKFNVRFPYTKTMNDFNDTLKECYNWGTAQIETANAIWDCEITDIPYLMFDKRNTPSAEYRVVAIRIPLPKTLKRRNIDEYRRQNRIKIRMKNLYEKKVIKEAKKAYNDDMSWKEIGGYDYKFFITNDYESSSEAIVLEYNKRGNAERKFTFMKNDFAWNLPPFMNMHENTVFLIIAALSNNIFRGMMALFKEKIRQIDLNCRIQKFQFIFIDVACAYINRAYIFYNTDIDYHLLI